MSEAIPRPAQISQESEPSFPGIEETFSTGILFNFLLNEIGVGSKNAITLGQLRKRLWKDYSREFAAEKVKSLKSILEKNEGNPYELVIFSQSFYLRNKQKSGL